MNPVDIENARTVAARLGTEWDLELGDELPGANCSVVLDAGKCRVLKVPFPAAEEAEAWETVMAFSGHGGVEVLKVDVPTGAMLMPRLHPGETLDSSGLSDLDQVDVCANLMLRLRAAQVVNAIPLATWFRELDEMESSFLVREARSVYAALQREATPSVLLHGDLHHFNILSHGDDWVVIDPKGVVGDPSFDVVGFIRNPIGKTPGVDGMRARLERFAERLGDPIERLWGWAFTQTVMCTHSPSMFGDACERAAQAIWEARP